MESDSDFFEERMKKGRRRKFMGSNGEREKLESSDAEMKTKCAPTSIALDERPVAGSDMNGGTDKVD